MNNEIREIIEKAMREAFEAGHWEGYQNGVYDRSIDDVRSSESAAYILPRNTEWAEYLKTLNMPADQT